MSLFKSMRRTILGLAVAAAATPGWLALGTSEAAAEFPTKPIKVYVGFKPGGRTDTIARKISQYINDNELLAQPMVIVNKPGAASANAAREVLSADQDGHTIMHWSHGMLISNALGVNEIHPEDFTSLGFSGGGSPVWAVRSDSEIKSLNDLVTKLKAEPESLVEAVGIGTVPHLIGAWLADSAGFKTRLIGAPGGADRLARLIGGNADIALFSAQEYKKFQPNGVNAVVFFGAERLANLPDVPTAKELGYDVVWANPAWWLGPKDMDPEAAEKLSAAIKTAIESDEMKAWFSENSLDPYWTAGPEATEQSLAVLTTLKKVAEDNNIKK